MSVTTMAPGRQPAHVTARTPAKKKPATSRRLLGLLRPHTFLVAVSLTLGIASVGLSLLGPVLLGRVTDLIVAGVIGRNLPGTITPEVAIQHLRETNQEELALVMETLKVVPGQGIDFPAVNNVLALALVLYVANVICLFLQGRLTVVVVQRVVYDMRERLEEKLSRLPISTFDSMSKGEILSRMTNDIDNVQRTLQQTVSGVLTSLFSVIGVLVIMFVISPLLMLIVVISVPLTGAVATKLGNKARVRFSEQWTAAGALNSYVEEMYTGHSLIKGFGKRVQAENVFDERNETMYVAAAKAQWLSGAIEPATWLIANLNYVAVAVVGAVRIGSGAVSVGDVQAFIQYSAQFGQSFAGVANVAGVLQSGFVSAARVFEVLDTAEQEPDPAEPTRPRRINGRVEFVDVSFSYRPDQRLIEDLSLTVEPGQTLAIVGESGSGKSTLGNLLLRFWDVDGGRIVLDGVDTKRMTRNDLRREIGLVSQDTWIFEGTIAENIAYGRPQATRAEIVAAAEAACLDRFVRTLPDGYDTTLVPDSSTISAGELQLLTVARVFLAGPRILVLDEATSSVDTRTELLIRRAMSELSSGRTSFIIAHRLSTIRDADMIIVMSRGQIVERGTHDELIAWNGHYAELYTQGTPPPTLDLPVVPVPPAVLPAVVPHHGTEVMQNAAAEVGREWSATGLLPGTFYPPARGLIAVAAAGNVPLPTAMRQAIAGLRGSITHQLSVEVYQRHVDPGDGFCGWCGERAPCTARLHAAAVVEAAGEDPDGYDRYPVADPADPLTLPLRWLPRRDI